MNKTLRNIKYLFLQAQIIFAFCVVVAIVLLVLFEGFLNFENGFQLDKILATAALNVPLLGILCVALSLGSYYQLLCPFYLSFSTTRKNLYISMKLLAWLPILEMFLITLILLCFTQESAKVQIMSCFPGLIGIAFIGVSFGELMGVISLKFVKFGRVFPALLGGIAGGIGGFTGSFLADVEKARSLTMAVTLNKFAPVLLIIGISLYLIINIAVYRIINKMSAQ